MRTTTRRPNRHSSTGRWWAAVGLLLALVLAISACSGDDSGDEAGDASAAQTAGAGYETAADALALDSEEAAGEGDGAAGGDAGRGGGDSAAEEISFGATLGRKVIHNARLTLEVDDPEEVVDRITAITERAGGFVAGADLQRSGEDGRLRGTLTLRIPTGRLTSALADFRDLAERIPEQRLDTEDVTGEYADIQAQLRNLRALEVELVALLEDIRTRSGSADEVLVVFERVRQVRGEIERLQGRQQVLDDLVALATVVVDVEPTPLAVAEAPSKGWRPGETVAAAARTTLSAFQELTEAAIWVAVTGIPVALLVLLPVITVAYGVRRWRRQDRPVPGGTG